MSRVYRLSFRFPELDIDAGVSTTLVLVVTNEDIRNVLRTLVVDYRHVTHCGHVTLNPLQCRDGFPKIHLSTQIIMVPKAAMPNATYARTIQMDVLSAPFTGCLLPYL